jgi:hypothetical protein
MAMASIREARIASRSPSLSRHASLRNAALKLGVPVARLQKED